MKYEKEKLEIKSKHHCVFTRYPMVFFVLLLWKSIFQLIFITIMIRQLRQFHQQALQQWSYLTPRNTLHVHFADAFLAIDDFWTSCDTRRMGSTVHFSSGHHGLASCVHAHCSCTRTACRRFHMNVRIVLSGISKNEKSDVRNCRNIINKFKFLPYADWAFHSLWMSLDTRDTFFDCYCDRGGCVGVPAVQSLIQRCVHKTHSLTLEYRA